MKKIQFKKNSVQSLNTLFDKLSLEFTKSEYEDICKQFDNMSINDNTDNKLNINQNIKYIGVLPIYADNNLNTLKEMSAYKIPKYIDIDMINNKNNFMEDDLIKIKPTKENEYLGHWINNPIKGFYIKITFMRLLEKKYIHFLQKNEDTINNIKKQRENLGKNIIKTTTIHITPNFELQLIYLRNIKTEELSEWSVFYTLYNNIISYINKEENRIYYKRDPNIYRNIINNIDFPVMEKIKCIVNSLEIEIPMKLIYKNISENFLF